MSMIKCPECGKRISEKALSCTNCGKPLLLSRFMIWIKNTMKHKIIFVAYLVLLYLLLCVSESLIFDHVIVISAEHLFINLLFIILISIVPALLVRFVFIKKTPRRHLLISAVTTFIILFGTICYSEVQRSPDDLLLLKYPRMSDRIELAREKGFNDKEISDTLEKFKLTLEDKKATQDNIDNYFGYYSWEKQEYLDALARQDKNFLCRLKAFKSQRDFLGFLIGYIILTLFFNAIMLIGSGKVIGVSFSFTKKK